MDREPEPPEGRNSSSSVAVSVCCLGAWELGLDRPAWNRFPLGPWPSGARGGAQTGEVRCPRCRRQTHGRPDQIGSLLLAPRSFRSVFEPRPIKLTLFAVSSLHLINNIFLSHKINTNYPHQPASNIFLSQKISTSHQYQSAEHDVNLCCYASIMLLCRKDNLV